MNDGYKRSRDLVAAAGIDGCFCHRCINDRNLSHPQIPGVSLSSFVMILCPDCGNKRCPKASDHRLECTGSNQSGQAGSVYQ